MENLFLPLFSPIFKDDVRKVGLGDCGLVWEGRSSGFGVVVSRLKGRGGVGGGGCISP